MTTESTTTMKQNAAKAALQFIQEGQIVGIGTGSTVNVFINELAKNRNKVAGAIASSTATEQLLKASGIPVVDFNAAGELPLYIDGADAYNSLKELVKGGGGALLREKILATASKEFICIVDASKQPGVLGTFPVAIEVLPMARSYVAREIIKQFGRIGARPQYRQNFVTDNGNIILDVFDWQITTPIEIEQKINQIAGVVENGIFAARAADKILIGYKDSVQII